MMKSPILARKAGMESCRGDPDVWVSSFSSDQRFDLDVLRRYIYIYSVCIYIYTKVAWHNYNCHVCV